MRDKCYKYDDTAYTRINKCCRYEWSSRFTTRARERSNLLNSNIIMSEYILIFFLTLSLSLDRYRMICLHLSRKTIQLFDITVLRI